MSADAALLELAVTAGIRPSYHDTTGALHRLTPETARALLAAMGLDAGTPAAVDRTLAERRADRYGRRFPHWLLGEPEQAVAVPGDGQVAYEITLEDGATLEGVGTGALPPLPMGRHRARLGGEAVTLLVAPAALALPAPGWGVTLPLYGLKPPAVGGLGDYRDLAAAAAALGRAGAGFVGINPVHAGFASDPGSFSPYAPSHRRRFATDHVGVAAPAASVGPLIDWPAERAARGPALRAAFAALDGPARDRFAAARARAGPSLEDFARHQALSQRHGPYWSAWPAAYRDPRSRDVAAFAAENAEEVAFHAWLQVEAETQLAAAAAAASGMAQGLYLDLAVGTHPYGAETWAEPHLFATDVSLGAPPDALGPQGQSWGLAPFDPHALVADGFAAFAETLRCALRVAGMLRIDHILGFDRAFWVPPDAPGGYVAMPRDALLGVARIEAARAGAVLIGEDLGNIPDGLQTALAASGILGCRVAIFERDDTRPNRFRPPVAYDGATLAAFGTHDTPTWAGWRRGRDLAWWQRLGILGSTQAAAADAARAEDIAAFDAALGLDGSGAITDLHAALARGAARLVAVQAEDLLGCVEQPNLPGTVHEHPNWRRRLPVGPGELAAVATLRETDVVMAAAGRRCGAGPDPERSLP